MSALALVNCEECEGKIERVITGGTGLIFKGSGFYLTDYKDGEKKPSNNIEKNKNDTEKSEKKNTKTENKSISKKTEKKDE